MFTASLAKQAPTLFRRIPTFLHRTPAPSKPRVVLPAKWLRYQGRYRRFDGANTSFRGANFLIRWSQHPNFYQHIAGIGLVTGGFYIYNLETVPQTGRRRFNVISDKLEKAIGEQEYQKVMQIYGNRILSPGDTRAQMVQKVMVRLIPAAGMGSAEQWEVKIINAPDEKNAFVIPGGKVFVFTGILPVCSNEEGLAAVLGHEIAHIVAHHQAETLSKSGVFGALIVLAISFLQVPDVVPRILYKVAFELPGSRTQESEADYIGLQIMAQSCYNPSAAVPQWQRMQVAEKGHAPPQLLSTHPTSKNRELQVQEWLPEAMNKYNANDCSVTVRFMDQFRERIQGPS